MIIRVMIVDDQKLMADGLRTILESREGFAVPAVALGGAAALSMLDACPVDLILLDIRMPGMNGVETAGRIKAACPAVKVVMLTTFNDEDYIMDAIAAGADGYLLKDMDADELFRSIESVMEGGMVMPRQVADKLRDGLAAARNRRTLHRNLEALGLSQREIEIAGLLSEGFTNNQIAEALYLSAGTVRNYVSGIYEKLDAADRVHAVIALRELERRR